MPENRVTYCLRLNHQGCVTSDLTVWKLEGHGYEVMSGNDDDIAALMSQQSPDCSIEDLSDSHSVFAVQGPESLLRLARLGNLERLFCLEYFEFCDLDIAEFLVPWLVWVIRENVVSSCCSGAPMRKLCGIC
jgi:glycine cleavage system aminomethyltransferase T